MLVKNKCYIDSTLEKTESKNGKDIEEIVNLIYINLNNRNHQKHHANSMKLFEEFGVENCKIVLIEEYPCQNRKQLEKRDGEYIGNDKSRLSGCFVGRDLNGILRCHRRASL